MKVIDNFLDNNDYDLLKEVFMGGNAPWYSGKILNEEDANKSKLPYDYNHQFVHVFYSDFSPQSNLIQIIEPIIKKIDPVAIARIKANLLTKTDKILEHGYHTDYSNLTTAIYYVNTNNGYTLFEDGTKIESVANRLVEFDSNLRHTGTTATDEPFRIVINFNYVKW
jgi:hypothetical protein